MSAPVNLQHTRYVHHAGKRCLQYFLLLGFCWNFSIELGRYTLVNILLVYVTLDGLLARVAGWGISTTPKAFDWTLESISLRPSWNSAYPSEIIIAHWTWHNPQSSSPAAAFHSPYILHVDRLSIRLDLWSICWALRDHHTNPVKVHEISLEGVRFYAKRNKADALNLWVALDLPDQVRQV